MKKDFKLVLFPLLALVIFGGIMMFMNREKSGETTSETPAAQVANILREGNYSVGPKDAKVTVVEFFDPECEGCAAFHPIFKKIMDEYPGRVHFVARYMLYHGNSYNAALALEGAGKQGKFWDLYAILLERQNEWSHQQGPVAHIFERYAKELKLDVEEFNKSYDDFTFKSALAKDVADGQQLGVKGTPTFFVNGKMLMRLSYQDLKDAIEVELAK